MRTRELKKAVQQNKQHIEAAQYVINLLNEFVKIMGEQTEKLLKEMEQKTAKKTVKKPAVKTTKKTVKKNPVKKIKKAIKKAK